MRYYAIANNSDEILAVSNSLSMVTALAQQQRPSLPGSAADYYMIVKTVRQIIFCFHAENI